MTRQVIFLSSAAHSRWHGLLENAVERLLPGCRVSQALVDWQLQVAAARGEAEGAGRGESPPSAALTPDEFTAALELNPAGDGRWGGVVAGMSWAIDDLLGRAPQSRCVALVESPAHSLSTWLVAGHDNDHEAALTAWADSARCLAQAVQRNPAQFLVIFAEELEHQPEALVSVAADWLGLELADSTAMAAPLSAPPALGAVAELLADRHSASQRWYQQLFACSTPVSLESSAPLQALRASLDAAALAPGLGQLRQWALDAPRLETALSALDRHERDAAAYAPTLNDALARAEANEAEVDTLLQALAETRCDAADAKQEARVVRVQLHQVFAELERFYRAANGLDPAERAPTGEAALQARRADFGPERDTPPHREYTLCLHNVTGGERHLAGLDLRLVEHHGRPGLVLLARPGEPTPLSHWRPAGEEAGRSFMLLIPDDEAAASSLSHMGTADWLFTLMLTRAVEAQVLDHAEIVPLRWRVAATRLREQMEALPPRFRYDAVQVDSIPGSQRAFSALFRNALFGQRLLPEVRLTWCADAALPRLEIAGPARGGERPVLCAWPVADDGAWQSSWQVPLVASNVSDEARRQWATLPTVDRQLVLAVMDALPAVAQKAVESDPAGKLDAAELGGLSRQQLAHAHAALRVSTWRRIARALRRRLHLNHQASAA